MPTGPANTASDFDTSSAALPSVQAAKERAARMAQAELEMEKKARAEAEHRAAAMALRALEAERDARSLAERRLEAEKRATERLQICTQAKTTRNVAATALQSAWRGYWVRACIGHGREELDAYARRIQATFRSKRTREVTKRLKQDQRDRLDYHVCISKSVTPLQSTRPLKRVVFDQAGPLLIGFDSEMKVLEVDPGGPGHKAGVVPGMQLKLFQSDEVDQPFLDLNFVDAMEIMRETPKPWIMTFDSLDDHAHHGRTLKSLVDDIREKLGIQPELSIKAAVEEALVRSETHDIHDTLLHKVHAVCHQLGISTEAQVPESVLISKCYKEDFNGTYDFVDHANGRPHWVQTAAGGAKRHLYFGSNDMWLLRTSHADKLDLLQPSASDFLHRF